MTPFKGATNIRGSAAYKKKDGTLSISKDQTSMLWIPIQSRDASSVTINIADITSMFWLGKLSLKMMLNPYRFTADTRKCAKGDAQSLRKVT